MSTPLTALLVDDEAPARERLTTLLADHPEVEIVGEAEDVDGALDVCERLRPAVVFLDVQLRREEGFDLLPRLSYAPDIIFVTAFDRYAVRAFEVNALDYLMKPVSPDRLARALARVSAPKAAGDLPAAQPGRLEETDRVSLRSDRGLRIVRVLDITHIEADENYTRVHVKGHPPAFVRRPMSEWERVLPEALFLRVERSLIVQLRAVREVLAGSRDAVRVAMVGQPEPIVLARRASLRLRNALRAR